MPRKGNLCRAALRGLHGAGQSDDICDGKPQEVTQHTLVWGSREPRETGLWRFRVNGAILSSALSSSEFIGEVRGYNFVGKMWALCFLSATTPCLNGKTRPALNNHLVHV